jgi:hypothetical protein
MARPLPDGNARATKELYRCGEEHAVKQACAIALLICLGLSGGAGAQGLASSLKDSRRVSAPPSTFAGTAPVFSGRSVYRRNGGSIDRSIADPQSPPRICTNCDD